jgi:hypothetical protein
MSPCENEGIHEGGGLNFYQLDSILQLQTSVAVSSEFGIIAAKGRPRRRVA